MFLTYITNAFKVKQAKAVDIHYCIRGLRDGLPNSDWVPAVMNFLVVFALWITSFKKWEHR